MLAVFSLFFFSAGGTVCDVIPTRMEETEEYITKDSGVLSSVSGEWPNS